MVIEKIYIRRFGRLSDVEMEFDPSFNLIEGPNESGKTTLASFLFYMLYGFNDKEGCDGFTERVLRAPWDGEEISGSLTLSSSGKRYLVERSSVLGESGKRDSYTLTDLDTGEKTENGKTPGELFLGVSSGVYEETAFFTAENYRVDGDGMTEAIENIVFSGSEKLSLVRAMINLKQVRTQLISPGGKSGALVSLEKERDALGVRLAEAKERERLLVRKEDLLFATREKRQDCTRELARFYRLETDYHNAMMIRDYDRLHELEDLLAEENRVIAAYENEHRTGVFLPSVAYLTELSTAKSQLDGARARLSSAEEALDKLKNEGSPVSESETILLERIRKEGDEAALRARLLEGKRKEKKEIAVFSSVFTLALAFLVLCFVMLSNSAAALTFAALALIAGGVGGVTVWEFLRTRKELLGLYDLGCAVTREDFERALAAAAETEKKKNEYATALSEAELLYRQAEMDCGAKVKILETALHRLHPELGYSEEYAESVKDIAEEVEAYLARATELYREKDATEAEVRALRTRLAGQNEIAVRALVPPDRREALCSHNAGDLRHGVEHYEKMLESFSEKVVALEKELSEMELGESSAAVSEMIMALDSRMRVMKENASLYGNAEEKLRGSFERLREEISPRLSLFACGLLSELTDGRYTELRIGEDLSLSVLSEEGEKDVAYLSRGTKEMTYLALRMSLLDLLYDGAPPVCLDECFAHQDDERAAAFMRTLETLTASTGMQCFLFTSQERERRLADRVFGKYRRITLRK